MNIPNGFKIGSAASGIKFSGNDVGLIVADENCVAAGVYTNNLVRAACIDQNREKTPTEKLRAVVVNSGNANACTGVEGEVNAHATAKKVADELECDSSQILVLSTGVIGEQLPFDKISAGIDTALDSLSREPASVDSLVQAFMTTDKFPKTDARKIAVADGQYQLLGIAKGAGMIGPNMATMLAVILIDAPLNPQQAQSMLVSAVDRSFNCISVDAHTSTNDAVLLLTSGRSETAMSVEDLSSIQEAITDSCIELAKLIPTDGEGAAHLIEIRVSGAETSEQADRVARVVANSNLVKTAISGCDPNWGRIVSAAGMAGIDLNPQKITLRLNETTIYESGTPAEFDETALSQSMVDQEKVYIELGVGAGTGAAVHWTSDLTVDYVTLNADYRT